MGNQTNASAKDEQAVQYSHLEVVFGFLGAECAAVAEEIDKADSDAAVDVENQVIFLGRGDRLDRNRIVEELGRGEVGLDKLFDELDAEVRIIARFDTMADARN